jgi:signal transduction histidine kinase/HAMP domain-containing protein
MRLYLKIALLMGGFLILALVLLVVFIYTSNSRQIEEQGLAQAQNLNRLAFEALFTSMSRGGGREGNREVIVRLQEVEGIAELRVVKGEPVRRQFGAEPGELPRDDLERRALAGEEAQTVQMANGFRLVRYATPLIVRPVCQNCHTAAVGDINGAIVTTISLQEHDLALTQQRNLLMLAAALTLVGLGAVSFFALRHLVVAPLAQIRAGAAAFANGHLGYRLRLRTGDELEETARAFNEMARQLEDSQVHLQEKVTERTRQLQEQAATLQKLKDELLAQNRLLQRANRELQALQELATTMWTTMNVSDMQEKILTGLVEKLGMKRATIGLAEYDGEALTGWLSHAKPEVAAFNIPHTARILLRPESGVIARAALERKPLIGDFGLPIADFGLRIANPESKIQNLAVLPMIRENRCVGVILVEGPDSDSPLDAEELATLTRLADQAALALSAVQVCMVKAQKLATAAERQRIAADIHDVVIQSLFGLVVGLEGCLNLLPGELQAAQERLRDLRGLAFKTLTETRRSIHELWPRTFGRSELIAALRRHVEEIKRLNGLSIGLSVVGEGEHLNEEAAWTLFCIAQEALSNVIRHAEATRAMVELEFGQHAVRMIVEDNGQGFDDNTQGGEEPVLSRGEGMGLRNMRSRAEILKGTLLVQSAPKKGTRIIAELPTADGGTL